MEANCLNGSANSLMYLSVLDSFPVPTVFLVSEAFKHSTVGFVGTSTFGVVNCRLLLSIVIASAKLIVGLREYKKLPTVAAGLFLVSHSSEMEAAFFFFFFSF